MTRAVYFPAGSVVCGQDLVRLTPQQAGWSFAGLRVIEMPAGASQTVNTGGDEFAILPLRGGAEITVGGEHLVLRHRPSVFSELPDVAYIPRGAEFTVTSAGGARLAMPFCPSRTDREPVLYPCELARVEIRGAGSCTRQVNNILDPAVAGPDRLLAVEVLTPGGNWSSYPPHKHDEDGPAEAILEEIYYFELRNSGFALQRLYTADGDIEVTQAVRHGDVFCIPRGYHGPAAAAPGYDLYYLNVLAGPGAVRTMAFCDDPDHHWVRENWAAESTDPRVPLFGAGNSGAPVSDAAKSAPPPLTRLTRESTAW